MSNTSLKLDISEGQIQNAIAVALAEALPPERKESMIRDIVRAHLQFKENSYDKETLLAKRIGAAIREIATDELKNVVELMRPDIEKTIRAQLGDNFKTDIIEQLERALKSITLQQLQVSVCVKTDDYE